MSDSSQPDAPRLTLEHLSDREIATATFLMVTALAERLTGNVPCLVMPDGDKWPHLVHGGDAGVVWLVPPESRGCKHGNGGVSCWRYPRRPWFLQRRRSQEACEPHVSLNNSRGVAG